MTIAIPNGLDHTQCLQVSDRLLVPAFAPEFSGFADLPPVFATACLVGFVEWACVEALRPYLDEGCQTVGTHVHLSHVAPTPKGMKVTARVELIEIKDRSLCFRVECFDEQGRIGSGYHERAVIDMDRFMSKVRAKAARLEQLPEIFP